jgi:hypothetical protein
VVAHGSGRGSARRMAEPWFSHCCDFWVVGAYVNLAPARGMN